MAQGARPICQHETATSGFRPRGQRFRQQKGFLSEIVAFEVLQQAGFHRSICGRTAKVLEIFVLTFRPRRQHHKVRCSAHISQEIQCVLET
eukprot:Skav202243  [mRNA]  locus=scaffold1417:141403:143065:- [translate_table: standard]